jgi:hypothetical protein
MDEPLGRSVERKSLNGPIRGKGGHWKVGIGQSGSSRSVELEDWERNSSSAVNIGMWNSVSWRPPLFLLQEFVLGHGGALQFVSGIGLLCMRVPVAKRSEVFDYRYVFFPSDSTPLCVLKWTLIGVRSGPTKNANGLNISYRAILFNKAKEY